MIYGSVRRLSPKEAQRGCSAGESLAGELRRGWSAAVAPMSRLPQKSHITHSCSHPGHWLEDSHIGPSGLCFLETHRSPSSSGIWLEMSVLPFLGLLLCTQWGRWSRLSLGIWGAGLGEGQAPVGTLQCQVGSECSHIFISKGQSSQASTQEETEALSQPRPQIGKAFMGKSIPFKCQGQVNTDFNDLPVASCLIAITYGGKSTGFEIGRSRGLTSALLTSAVILGRLLSPSLPVRAQLPHLQWGLRRLYKIRHMKSPTNEHGDHHYSDLSTPDRAK